MTVIIGMIKNGYREIIADKAISDSEVITKNKISKIFKKFDMLIGASNELAIGQAIKSIRDFKKEKKETELDFIQNEIIPKIIKKLNESNLLKNNEMEGRILIVGHENIYTIQCDFSLFIDEEREYAAIGSGEDVAIGIIDYIKMKDGENYKLYLCDVLEAISKRMFRISKDYNVIVEANKIAE